MVKETSIGRYNRAIILFLYEPLKGHVTIPSGRQRDLNGIPFCGARVCAIVEQQVAKPCLKEVENAVKKALYTFSKLICCSPNGHIHLDYFV